MRIQATLAAEDDEYTRLSGDAWTNAARVACGYASRHYAPLRAVAESCTTSCVPLRPIDIPPHALLHASPLFTMKAHLIHDSQFCYSYMKTRTAQSSDNIYDNMKRIQIEIERMQLLEQVMIHCYYIGPG